MFTAFHVHYHGRHCGIEGFVMRGEAIPPLALRSRVGRFTGAARPTRFEKRRQSPILPLCNTTASVLPLLRSADGRDYSRQRRDLVFYLIGRSMKAAFGRNYRLCADGQMIIGCPTCRRFIDERLIRVGIRTLCLPSQ
jgi:hypothetical protein